MIRNVGLVVNYRKKQPLSFAKKLINWFEEKGISVFLPPEDGMVMNIDKKYFVSNLGQKVDCTISLGGDGTFLRGARLMAPYGIPVLGINMGTLGFLTELEVSEIDNALDKLICGQYYLEDRMMLEAKLLRNNEIIDAFVGLNDVVINKGPLARLNTLEIFMENDFITTYQADGVIISSPTGSTAYSLSAGGPIVYPEVDIIIITPICPHTLQNRPMVVPSDRSMRILISNQQSDSMLTIDGQNSVELYNGDEIVIRKASYNTRLIRITGQDFFSVLREKLRAESWSSYE